jgi:hypothetical protein
MLTVASGEETIGRTQFFEWFLGAKAILWTSIK